MKQRDTSLRVELRDPPDLKRLVRAAIQIATEMQAADHKREEAKARRRQSGKKTI